MKFIRENDNNFNNKDDSVKIPTTWEPPVLRTWKTNQSKPRSAELENFYAI